MLGGRPTKPAVATHLSIVVLPFANLSGDPAQDYLVDALTDELTTSLVRITGNFVIARNTAMTFKSMPVDAKAIGKELSVRYVLEGSVQDDPGSGGLVSPEIGGLFRAEAVRSGDRMEPPFDRRSNRTIICGRFSTSSRRWP
jgi:hypothetical protein